MMYTFAALKNNKKSPKKEQYKELQIELYDAPLLPPTEEKEEEHLVIIELF